MELRQQLKSIFTHNLDGRGLFFVADQVVVSGDLPTRLSVTGSSPRFVSSLRAGVGEEYYLTQQNQIMRQQFNSVRNY